MQFSLKEKLAICEKDQFGNEKCEKIIPSYCIFNDKAINERKYIPLENNQYNWIIIENPNNPVLSNGLKVSLGAKITKNLQSQFDIKCNTNDTNQKIYEIPQIISDNNSLTLVQFAPFSGFNLNFL